MSNMYGQTADIQESLPKFPISDKIDNVVLEKVEYVNTTSKKGNEYEALVFTFSRKLPDGTKQMFLPRVLPVNQEQILGWEGAGEDTVAQKFKELNQTINHIARVVTNLTKEEIEEKTLAKSFSGFARKYANMVNELIDENGCPMMFMKLVPNKKNYPALPKFPDFLQRMSDGLCSLAYTEYETKEMKKTNTMASTANEILEEEDDLDGLDLDD